MKKTLTVGAILGAVTLLVAKFRGKAAKVAKTAGTSAKRVTKKVKK